MTVASAQVISALTEHKNGDLGHEATLMRLVLLLKERPHLLCGLSMWVPDDKVRSAGSPAYLELRVGVMDTLNRCKSSTVQAVAL